MALREHTFLQESERSIDAYIAQGQAALSNLVEQRGILKGTKTRLLDAANTLGLSRETIGWVERRT
jgi:Golgi SNAP receptor complex protein 2